MVSKWTPGQSAVDSDPGLLILRSQAPKVGSKSWLEVSFSAVEGIIPATVSSNMAGW